MRWVFMMSRWARRYSFLNIQVIFFFFLNQDFVLNTPNNESNVIYRVWDELNVALPE